jgi:hypothetical protein
MTVNSSALTSGCSAILERISEVKIAPKKEAVTLELAYSS